MIKRERKRKYKAIKKAFKARDAASKYIDKTARVSVIMDRLSVSKIKQLSTKDLARMLIDASWFKPDPPPPQNAKPSIK